jgi:aspartate dehydrogenase
MTVFEGTAKEAVSLFPANINVAALLSLSGIGSERTNVKIVADPDTDKNTHHIEAAGKFGKMTQTIFRLAHNMAIIAPFDDFLENYGLLPIL